MKYNNKPNGITRRQFTAGMGTLLGASALGMPMIGRAAEPLKVGAYGGYFKDSFDKYIFPDFTAATGISVESVAEPTGEAWLVQLQTAAMAGQAPADVSMMSQVSLLKGLNAGLWMGLDEKRMPNASNVLPQFIRRNGEGQVAAVGAVAWFITLVTNTDTFPEAPTSWAALWDEGNRDRVGLMSLASNSFLLEITAKTFFGGTGVLGSREGVDKVLAKIAELKSNVRLWYRDEGQFEQALKSGEIPMGQYYHDVAGLAAGDGHPVRTTFPKEGGVSDAGSWCISRASKQGERGMEFINYMCQAEVQAKLARMVGTAPIIPRAMTGLSDDEFNAVSSEIDPILPRYDIYDNDADWINQRWTEMISG